MTATLTVKGTHLYCQGQWTQAQIADLAKRYHELPIPEGTNLTLEGSTIEQLDSAGAWLLHKIKQYFSEHDKTLTLQGFAQNHQSLFNLISQQIEKMGPEPASPEKHNVLYRIGEETVNKGKLADNFLAFLGEMFYEIYRVTFTRRKFRWRGLLSIIETTGYNALPIIALLSFLIGVVLTYQMGLQLKLYGANVYIVNLSGMAILREFAPLITAIIVAGRTGSSYTAQLGMMKVNQEVDALRTMGLSPINHLVIPKVFGLMIALPLLTVWADAFGVMGSMIMAKTMLGVGYTDFLTRFDEVISLRTYVLGLIKTPVFAILIASVGCFQGFNVGDSADSVGFQTTKSVVQAIFLIIIADAFFSIMFSYQGL